jgi:hypothetical protein
VNSKQADRPALFPIGTSATLFSSNLGQPASFIQAQFESPAG